MKTVFELLNIHPLDTWDEFKSKTQDQINYQDLEVCAALTKATSVYQHKASNLLSLIQTKNDLNSTLHYLDENDISSILEALAANKQLSRIIQKEEDLLQVLNNLEGRKLLIVVNGLRRLPEFDAWARAETGSDGPLSPVDALHESVHLLFQGRMPRGSTLRTIAETLTATVPLASDIISGIYNNVNLKTKQINRALRLGLYLNNQASAIESITALPEDHVIQITNALGDFDIKKIKQTLDAAFLFLSSSSTMLKPLALNTRLKNHTQKTIQKTSTFYYDEIQKINLYTLGAYFVLGMAMLSMYQNTLSAFKLLLILRLITFVAFAGKPVLPVWKEQTTLTPEEQFDRFISLLSSLSSEYAFQINKALGLGMMNIQYRECFKNRLIKYVYDLHSSNPTDTFLTEGSYGDVDEKNYEAQFSEILSANQKDLLVSAHSEISNFLNNEIDRMKEMISGNYDQKIELLTWYHQQLNEKKEFLTANRQQFLIFISLIGKTLEIQTSRYGKLLQHAGVEKMFGFTKSQKRLMSILDQYGLPLLTEEELTSLVNHQFNALEERESSYLELESLDSASSTEEIRALESVIEFLKSKTMNSEQSDNKIKALKVILDAVSQESSPARTYASSKKNQQLYRLILMICAVETSTFGTNLENIESKTSSSVMSTIFAIRDIIGWWPQSYKDFSALLKRHKVPVPDSQTLSPEDARVYITRLTTAENSDVVLEILKSMQSLSRQHSSDFFNERRSDSKSSISTEEETDKSNLTRRQS